MQQMNFRIELGGMAIEDMKLDFGVIDPYDRINGLLGTGLFEGCKGSY